MAKSESAWFRQRANKTSSKDLETITESIVKNRWPGPTPPTLVPYYLLDSRKSAFFNIRHSGCQKIKEGGPESPPPYNNTIFLRQLPYTNRFRPASSVRSR